MAVFTAAAIVLEVFFWFVLLSVAAVFVAALIHRPYNGNAESERDSAINRSPIGRALEPTTAAFAQRERSPQLQR